MNERRARELVARERTRIEALLAEQVGEIRADGSLQRQQTGEYEDAASELDSESVSVALAERKVRFMEVAFGGFLGLGESKSLIPVEAITRMTPDAVYIGHTRAHVAGAPRYDPDLVETRLDNFFNLYPYYGYPTSFGLSPFMVASPDYKSAKSAADGNLPARRRGHVR